MRCKSFDIMSVTLILLALDWGSISNFNSTITQVAAASCKDYVGEISEIRDGSVERKQPGEQWQKIDLNTKLCYGDILKTTSNRGKKVIVKVKCTASDEVEERAVPDLITGVLHICSSSEYSGPPRKFIIRGGRLDESEERMERINRLNDSRKRKRRNAGHNR